ncbi:class I SAM-dependent methyltransferase [Gramella sp. BOM4]|nr:class I SAM-dependent methyltransferase [Christiangramia bathymodioli]
MLCSLCFGNTLKTSVINQKEYLQCLNCKAIFLASRHYLLPSEEKARYEAHNNDVTDPGYREFVKPVVEEILKQHSADSLGLDYGCGTGPVISHELSKKGYQTVLFDPFFNPDDSVLERSFDYIICCEVMEHFQHPMAEFQKLRSILRPGGKLYCKTSLYSEDIDFENWYYKDDATHVTFYTTEALEHLKNRVGFSGLEIMPELIVFTR